MILLADENIDQTVVNRLRSDGHDVLAVGEMAPGVEDSEVLALANERHALLITEDKDFGELAFRQNLAHSGVILMRLAGLPAKTKGGILSRALARHAGEMAEAFSVISRGALRIRRRAG